LHTNPEDTNSGKTEDNKEKANILCDYLASVFTNEPIGELPQMTLIEIQNELKDLVINKDMVLKLLQNLKIDKSPGPIAYILDYCLKLKNPLQNHCELYLINHWR
jgi:hypothetical protein